MRTSSPSRLALILCAHQGCANTNEDKNAPPLWSRKKDFVHKNYPDPNIFNSPILKFLIKRTTGTERLFSGAAFFLPPKENFFSLKGVARQMAVRCKGLSADGNTRIHRCRQHLAALVLRTYTFQSFFFLFFMIG